MPIPTEQDLSLLKSQIQERMKSAVLGPPSALSMRDMKKTSVMGAKLRNNAVWDLRLVRQAVFAFIELGSTREWTVSGKPSSVSKTVEVINNAASWDINTGYVQHSFEAYLRRRALDYVTIGRTAFATRNIGSAQDFMFEYLDPTLLFWNRKEPLKKLREKVYPVKPEDKVWNYGYNDTEPEYQSREVHISHAIPIGAAMDSYMSPLMLVYSTAVLAWLVEQHDTASLDGRKIRDIFIVDKGLFAPLVQAIAATLALWSGADPSKEGLPIVEATQTINGSLQDRIAQLGLSKIPEAFDRRGFEHSFANDIAGALGLALRHFWQDDSNTNRALEEVQESRQQQKGPLAFVRTEERLINNSHVVRQYSSPNKPSKFAFVEETDTSALKDKAQAMSMYADGLSKIKVALEGIGIKPAIVLAQIQSVGWLPQDIAVEDMVVAGTSLDEPGPGMEELQGTNEIAAGSTPSVNTRTEVTQKAWDPERDLDYGQMVMSGKGAILAYRRPVYSVAKILKRETDAEDLLASDVK